MSLINEKLNIDDLKKMSNEYAKIKERIRRHGENIVNKRGRKPLGASHKKKVRIAYREKIKQQKIEEGTYKPRGRPRKIGKN